MSILPDVIMLYIASFVPEDKECIILFRSNHYLRKYVLPKYTLKQYVNVSNIHNNNTYSSYCPRINSVFVDRVEDVEHIPPTVTRLNILNNPVLLFPTMTHRILGEDFNKMGYWSNKPIPLPNTLTHLTLGYFFNQPIILPETLTHLTMGSVFNQPITLPSSLTHLDMGYSFNQPITLPEKLTFLIIGHSFNHPITIPATIKYKEDHSTSVQCWTGQPSYLASLIRQAVEQAASSPNSAVTAFLST